MEKFIELFANLFDETDINVFTPQTKFKELEEWSSLIALSVILMVDEEYGITIEGMTVGLVTPNEGKIFLNDMEITKFPVYKRARNGIGYLAQEASIFRKMTVEDNIRSVLEMTETTPEYQKEKLESLIAEFGLNKVRKNLGDQLSGGERRRAEIARCLAIDPKFIMLDEPFAGVDPIAVQDIQTIVARLKHKNIGILITDHNVYETLSICDRAYLLFEGKVLFQGTAEQLAENEIVREKYLGKDFVLRKKDL